MRQQKGKGPKFSETQACRPRRIERITEQHIYHSDHCASTVSGEAAATRNLGQSKAARPTATSRVHLDYCFLTEDSKNDKGEGEKTSLTTLVMKESECKSLRAYPVMSNGAANKPWVVKQILHDLDTIGLSQERIIIKNDQEPAITDLKAELARQRKAVTAPEESRVGDSNSNATIEVAVQEVENIVRALRSRLESGVKSKIPLDHPIVTWLIRHAAANITRFKVRSIGKTAFQLMKGFKGKNARRRVRIMRPLSPTKSNGSRRQVRRQMARRCILRIRHGAANTSWAQEPGYTDQGQSDDGQKMKDGAVT